MLGRLRNRKAKGGDREGDRGSRRLWVYISKRFASTYLVLSAALYTLRTGREAVTRDTAQQRRSEITTLLTILGPRSIPLITGRGAGDGSRGLINQQRPLPPLRTMTTVFYTSAPRPSDRSSSLAVRKGTFPGRARPRDSVKGNILCSRYSTGVEGGGLREC